MDADQLKRLAVFRFSSAALVLGVVFFVTAGTIGYWQAWLYMAVTLVPMMAAVAYLMRHDRELLERRLATREERKQQGAIQKFGSVVWLSILVLPGLDQRFGWSEVPWLVVVVSALLVLTGYLLFFRVLQENSYASRIIEVQEGQAVITTGPYAVVRHPMYSAVFIMFVFSPLALGSYWALIPASLTPVILVFRIVDEEKMLLRELPQYHEYARRTRYRLIPRVW